MVENSKLSLRAERLPADGLVAGSNLFPVLLSLLLLTTGGLGCSKGPSSSSYLKIHLESEPASLSPAEATGHRESQVILSIYEGLTRYHPETLEPLPGVAERWEISPDGKIYTFYLRENARWSDGTPVTAQNFWNSWERALNPKVAAPYAFQFYYIKNGESYSQGILTDPKGLGMEVVSLKIFRVTLERPIPYFLYLTAFSALATSIYGKPNVANGPFMIQDWKKGKELTLVPNPEYWGHSEVKLSGIQFRFFNNFQLALQHYDAKGIDILADLPPTVSNLRWRSDFRSTPILRTEYFILNVNDPVLKNRSFRKALSLAIDRETLAKQILQREDLPYGTLVPPKMPSYTSPTNAHAFQPEEAKRLLKEAGYRSGVLIPVLNLHHNDAPDRILVAESVAKMWKQYLGIEAKLFKEDWKGYLQRRRNKDFQISWGGWYGDYLDPYTFLELFEGNNNQNYTGWKAPEYDQLLKESLLETDVQKRAHLFQGAEALLLSEAPVIPVLVKAKNYLIQPYVSGYYNNTLHIHPYRDIVLLRH